MPTDILTVYPWHPDTHGNSTRIDFSCDPTHDLLETADPAALKLALQQLCRGAENARIAAQVLGYSMEKTKKTPVSNNSNEKVAICEGCGKQFDEGNNPLGFCNFYRFHPYDAMLNEDSEYWAEDHQREGWSIDDRPDGFKYECCGGRGTRRGCARFRHVPVAATSSPTHVSRTSAAIEREVIRGKISVDRTWELEEGSDDRTSEGIDFTDEDDEDEVEPNLSVDDNGGGARPIKRQRTDVS